MANKGYIYKGLQPVYWCPDWNTALAEAEIEYAEDPCHSIYVKFNVTDDLGKLTAMGADLSKTYFVIWTTPTWTLPANVAICVGPDFEYSLIKSGDEYYVMATDLAASAMEAKGVSDYETLGVIKGSELEYMKPSIRLLTAHLLLLSATTLLQKAVRVAFTLHRVTVLRTLQYVKIILKFLLLFLLTLRSGSLRKQVCLQA